jgi:hypothetical protein
MLLLLKDLLAKLIITCTLKDKRTTWLCLVEGYLASLHDLVRFMIEHTICSSSIVRAISHNVLFILSTTPFWGGVYGLENWCS